VVDAADRVAAVQAIRNMKNFAPLAASFKRIKNILEKSAGGSERAHAAVNAELLWEPAEKELHAAALRIGEAARAKKKNRKYREALEAVSELRPAIDGFFDNVLVMVEDKNVRANRIALLANLLREFSAVADFSELGGDEARNA
jgi:glycyl-tRNA synthetase beta chain